MGTSKKELQTRLTKVLKRLDKAEKQAEKAIWAFGELKKAVEGKKKLPPEVMIALNKAFGDDK